MKFGPIAVREAAGAIAAHSIRHASGMVKKGTVLTDEIVAQLAAHGIAEVVGARLEPGDMHEDAAAEAIAGVLAGPAVRAEPAATGRSNLFSETGGVLVVDRESVDRLNRLDPGITLATLPNFSAVEPGRMVATVKIIPFAVPAEAVSRASEEAPVLRVAEWRRMRVGLVQSRLPGTKESVLDKTRRVFEERLARGSANLAEEARTAHDLGEMSHAIRMLAERCDLIVCFGASAITDRGDVIPAAVELAGGKIRHLGMPVDPGNLLLLADLNGKAVLGAPGCARSPVENGFDWVLNRLLAGVDVEPEDITAMGVGGLLMEIVSRPQPRQPIEVGSSKIASVVLAAGQSRRMGGPNKLLATFGGVPLVRRSVEAALESAASPVIVVTGHMAEEVRSALAGLDVIFVHNPAYGEGLSGSLRAGLSAVPDEAGGAIIQLADMPGVDAAILDRLIQAFEVEEGPAIVLPTVDGKRGNPVVWSRHFFAELGGASGDVGARHLLGKHEDAIRRVEIGPAAALDVDTPEALRAAGGVWDGRT